MTTPSNGSMQWSVESWDPRFDPSATRTLLESLGARGVELVES